MKAISLATPHMSEEGYEKKYVKEAFDLNWIAPLGNNVNEFEKALEDYTGAGHAVALASGTAALHMAIRACGVGPGDEVLCQSLTFAASCNPIVYQGAKPVFVDSEWGTWNMDPQALADAAKAHPKAKVVELVHLYGIPADLDPILEVCRDYDLVLVEDACESLGTTYKGKATGTFGKCGALSFNGNKIITTSGGGAFLTDDEDLAHKVFFWATQSKEDKPYYWHKELGYNYRLSNVCAGIGRGQMKVLDKRKAKKKAIFKFYQENLKDIEEISMMPQPDFGDSNCWLSSIQIEDGKVSPEDLYNFLKDRQIETRPIWKPMNLQPYYQDCDFVGSGVCDEIYKHGLCLPSDTKMSEEDQAYVCQTIKEAFN